MINMIRLAMDELSKCFDGGYMIGYVIFFEVLIYVVGTTLIVKKYPYRSAKSHFLIFATMGIMVVVVYTLDKFNHFAKLDSWVALADNILSGALFSILCIVMWKIEKNIRNQYEDREKLTQDYENLSKKYEKDNLIVVRNIDGTEIKYPVICEGMGSVFIKDENAIKIDDSPNTFFEPPKIVENNYFNIFSIHETSCIYNNLNIRVKDMSFKNNEIYFQTERTTYYASLVTNRAADFYISEGISIRELYESGPWMKALCDSQLSNHLGFNGFIESQDGFLVFVKRSREVSIGKNTYGDSIGASLKVKYALDDNERFTQDGLVKAIYKEIEDELAIKEEEIEEGPFIIGLYRDCVECGKPQFLIYAKSKLNAEEITEHFLKKDTDSKKKRWMKNDKEFKMLRDGFDLVWINTSEINQIIFDYNGIRINTDINDGLKGFVSFDRRKKQSKITRLDMVPSASASLWMLKMYKKVVNDESN